MHTSLLLGAVSTAVVLGYVDHKSGHMPNWMNALSFTWAAALQIVLLGERGAFSLGSGMVVCGAAPVGLYLFTKGVGIGGGDVKALVVLGAWLGPELGLEVQLVSLLLLALGALAQAARRGQALALLGRSLRTALPFRGSTDVVHEISLVRTHLRFGPYLALGTCLCCFNQYLSTRHASLHRFLQP